MTPDDLRRLETDEALARLSVVDDDPAGWSRRQFLRAVGWGIGGGVVLGGAGAPGLGRWLDGTPGEAWAAPLGSTDGILVVIGMFGGNDGFDTVVRYGDPAYAAYRGGLAIGSDRALPIADGIGLHPNLSFVRERYAAGEVAIVQGLGYPNPDFSHFFSMATWMSAITGGAPSTGWIGRWLDARADPVDALVAASVGTSVPLHMVGQSRRAVGVPSKGAGFGATTDPNDLRLFDGLRAFAATPAGRGAWHDMVASTVRSQLDVAATTAPVFVDPLPSGQIQQKLAVAARLINANLGLRVLEVSWGGFDSHESQAWMHGERMAELDAGLRAFFETLAPWWRNRVAVMTFSEFGRTPYANGSAGTDHGTVGDHFVIGANVAGGFHGAAPTLAGLQRWDRPAMTLDFRSYYASVLEGWMGSGSSSVIGGQHELLPLFKAGPGVHVGPGAPPPPPPPPPVQVGGAGDFVPLTPTRVLDTRHGTGAPKGPVAGGSHVDVALLGRAGVPSSGVTAVVLNLTGTGATQDTFLTAFGAGRARPATSSVSLRRGASVPNLVVAELGTGGAVRVYNDAGSAHCLADVVGYFTTSRGSRLLPLAPARVVDTRSGLGAPKGKLRGGQTVWAKVAGKAGIPADATAVVLNLTATGATRSTFATLWPAGVDRPLASSLNVTPGTAVSNLVVAPVGAGGHVLLYHDQGATHLVADVLGCFTTTAPGRHVAVTPQRLLDTRRGVGAPAGPVGRAPVVLQVAGRGGVPASGASAVLLNVTITSPSAATFVTVWPSGAPRPLSSNLLAPSGRTVANMVLATLGADGKVLLYHDAGSAHLLADVVGYFTGG